MISVKEATKNYINGGKGKTTMPLGRMFVLAFLAGMFIALAGTAATIASSTVTNSSVAKVITSLVFPAGLAMVIINGTELFTGNNLMTLALMNNKITAGQMLKNWCVVWLGNLVGSLCLALIVYYGGVLGDPAATAKAVGIAEAKAGLDISVMIFRGILCNILVVLAVWMATSAQDIISKIFACWFPIMLFVLCGFEHSVANMYFISAGLFSKSNAAYLQAAADAGIDTSALTWGSFFGKNLLPVTIGNIIGGAICVGCVYWFVYVRKNKKEQ